MIPGPWSRATQCLLPTEHPSSIQPTVMYVSCLIECEEDLNKESLTTMTRLYYSLRHSPLSKPIVWSLVYFSQLIITSHSQSQFFAYLDFRFGALFKFSFSQGPLFRRHILIFTCKFNLQPRRLRLFFLILRPTRMLRLFCNPLPVGLVDWTYAFWGVAIFADAVATSCEYRLTAYWPELHRSMVWWAIT